MPRIIYRNSSGVILPGVTTVISNLGWNTRPLMHWAWKQGWDQKDYRDEQKKAANIGTAAHKLIEIDCLRGDIVQQDIDLLVAEYGQDVIDPAMVAFESWWRWKKSENFSPVEAEESLVSEELQVGGTFDLLLNFSVATINDRKGLVSLKVTRDVYKEHLIQEATYGYIYNENYPDEPVEDLYWLKLGKEAASFTHEWLPYDCDKVRAAIEIFKHLRAIHALKKELK